MKIILKSFFLFFVSAFTLLYSSCSHAKPRYEQLFGTICVVNLFDDGNDALYDEIFNRLESIDNEFSIDKKHSDLARVNARAFVEPVTVGDDFYTVLTASLIISALTEGAFDVSVEPLVSLWSINSTSPHLANQEEINSVLPLVDYKNIVINPANKSVHFLKEGMSIDFGGIAKGYAADEIVKICEKHKVQRAVIDLGGNVYVYGKKSNEKNWNVGIKNPQKPDSAPLIKLSTPQISVVTSGIYERYFEAGERQYHHILSPFDGYPVENELSSVTVICVNSMIADGLTTAFFTLGEEKSIALLPKISSAFNLPISVVFLERDNKIKFSPDFPFEHEVLYADWSEKL